MSSLIWDSATSAFKDSEIPKVWDSSTNAWKDTYGYAYQNGNWNEVWVNAPVPRANIIVYNNIRDIDYFFTWGTSYGDNVFHTRTLTAESSYVKLRYEGAPRTWTTNGCAFTKLLPLNVTKIHYKLYVSFDVGYPSIHFDYNNGTNYVRSNITGVDIKSLNNQIIEGDVTLSDTYSSYRKICLNFDAWDYGSYEEIRIYELYLY